MHLNCILLKLVFKHLRIPSTYLSILSINFLDESYLIGKGMAPVQAYLSIDEYIRIAKVV
jgi:hypothetical protein